MRLSVQIFKEDDPELYARLQALPASKIRRRSDLIRLLRLGALAERNALDGIALDPPRSSDAISQSAVVLPEATASSIPHVTSGNKTPTRYDTVIDPEDLVAVFGPPITSNS